MSFIGVHPLGDYINVKLNLVTIDRLSTSSRKQFRAELTVIYDYVCGLNLDILLLEHGIAKQTMYTILSKYDIPHRNNKTKEPTDDPENNDSHRS